MKKSIILFVILSLYLFCFNCAKKGQIQGGPKDIKAPIILEVKPLNRSTSFDSEEIKIKFDEFVKIVNPTKNIIISPPFKEFPRFEPLGTPKRTVTIRFLSSLEPNTTYTIKFGNSIVDNNEENKYGNFSYVFSSGKYIDSLKIIGIVRDALKRNVMKKGLIGMLYKKDSSYQDSLIRTTLPYYMNFSDSLGVFRLENLKSGNYQMIVIEDKNGDYKYQKGDEKIGFIPEMITLPSKDSIQNLILFKEKLDKAIISPSQTDSGRIDFLFKGEYKGFSLKQNYPLDSVELKTLTIHSITNDTISVWHKFKKGDSLSFNIYDNEELVDTISLKVSNLEKLEWDLNLINSSIDPSSKFGLDSNIPIVDLKDSLINITSENSLPLSFSSTVGNRKMSFFLNFPIFLDSQYIILLKPGAVTNFFGQTNDTLSFEFTTKSSIDFGIINLKLSKPLSSPFFLDLLDKKEEILRSNYYEKNATSFTFDHLSPGEYSFRIRIDENRNKKWDSGNFKLRIIPEPVIHFPRFVNVRAYWELNEIW